MSVPRRLIVALLLVVTVLTVASNPFVADAQQARAFVWDSVDVTVALQADSTLHVTERDRIVFSGGPFHTGHRDIPLAHVERLDHIQVAAVSGANVQPLRYVAPDAFAADIPDIYTFRTMGPVVRIEWSFPSTTSAERTFQLDYDAHGALRVYPDRDPPYQQLSWTGVDPALTKTAPVNTAMLTFVLPHPVNPDQSAVFGPGGSAPGDHTSDGKIWTWTASNLEAGDFLEATLQFPPLVPAAKPAWQEAADQQEAEVIWAQDHRDTINLALLGLGALLAVVGAVSLAWLWHARGRDSQPDLVTGFLSQPPDDSPPGVAGTLLDETVDAEDIVATLVDLGRRGVIVITECAGKGQNGAHSPDFTITLDQQAPAVAPFETAFLLALFGEHRESGQSVQLSEVKGRLAAAQTAIIETLYLELVRRGYFAESPQATRSTWRLRGALLITYVVVGGVFAQAALGTPFVWIPGAVVIVLAVALAVISRAMPRKTSAGATAAAKWHAFRTYLEAIERYESLDEAQSIFERYLPYAVAFGLARDWVHKFTTVAAPMPGWYRVPAAGGRAPLGTGSGRGWVGAGGGTGSTSTGTSAGQGSPVFEWPGLQAASDQTAWSLQSSSDGLFSLLDSAAGHFSGFAPGGSARGWSRGGGGTGSSGGFGGGGGGGGGGGFS